MSSGWCRWWQKKLWPAVIFWWILMLHVLLRSILDIPLHTDQLSDEISNALVWPEDADQQCPQKIDTFLQKWKFKDCSTGWSCREFSCKDVLTGGATVQRKVEKNRETVMASDKDIARIASNCDDLFEYGMYISSVGTDAEMNFPLAYSILVYQDAGQVERLLRSIYQPNNVYCFHIDQKARPSFKLAMEKIAGCFPNVILSSRSVRVIYAGFSRLYADILCMKDLVKSKHHWKYLINLAGSVMPIKTNWEIVQVLSLYNGTNDIEILPLNRTIKERFSHKWMISNEVKSQQQLVRTNMTKPPPPHNLTIVRGSAYGAFSRAFVDFVLEDEVAGDLLDWSVDTYSPDEHYWATLHCVYHNPQLRTPGGFVGPPELSSWVSSYSSWPSEEPCLGKETARTSPCVFGVRSLPNLIQRPELFVNKFSLGFEPIAQVCLGVHIQLRTRCQTKFNRDYYLNMRFIKNRALTIA